MQTLPKQTKAKTLFFLSTDASLHVAGKAQDKLTFPRLMLSVFVSPKLVIRSHAEKFVEICSIA